jgi:hypothetical protein
MWEGTTDPKTLQQGFPVTRTHLDESDIMHRTRSSSSGLPFWAMGKEQLHP